LDLCSGESAKVNLCYTSRSGLVGAGRQSPKKKCPSAMGHAGAVDAVHHVSGRTPARTFRPLLFRANDLRFAANRESLQA
jgi:hypothetical protein